MNFDGQTDDSFSPLFLRKGGDSGKLGSWGLLNAIFALLLLGGGIFCSGYAGSIVLPASSKVIALFLLLLLLGGRLLGRLLTGRRSGLVLSDGRLVLYSIFCILFLFSPLVHGMDNGVLLPWLCISVAFGVTMIYSFSQFISAYLITLRIITVVAFLFLLLYWCGISSLLPVILGRENEMVSYYNGIVCLQLTTAPETLIGVFWEPGLFCSFLILGICFEFYAYRGKKKSWGTIILFALGILFSRSTAGLLLLLMLLGAGYEGKNSYWCVCRIFLMITIGILCFIFQVEILHWLADLAPDIFEKLINVEAVTTNTRLFSPRVNWDIFMQRPWTGWGFNAAGEEYLELIAQEVYGRMDSQTSSFGVFLAAFGIWGGVYALAWIWGIFRQRLGFVTHLTLCVILIIILNKEPHMFLLSSYVVLFYLVGPRDSIQEMACTR